MLTQTRFPGFQVWFPCSGSWSSLPGLFLGKPSLSVRPDKDLDMNGGLSESAYFILSHAAAGDGCINATAGFFEVVTL